MTNEEIDRRIADAVLNERSGTRAPFWGLFRDIYRHAYAAGLEDAAQVAGRYAEHTYEAHVGNLSNGLAKEIRALKDSPVQEPVSSAP